MKAKLIAVAVAALAVAVGCSRVRDDSYVLAVRGRLPGVTVVLPAAASASQKYAAEELVKFVERMTGVKLPVTDDSAAKPPRAILLGATRHTRAAAGWQDALGPDGFHLRVDGDDLVVLGSPVRGTLNGVYELLEKYGGCRWYSSWTEVIPTADAFKVPAKLDDRQVPALPHREPFWFDMFNGDFAARNKANGPSMLLKEKHGGPYARFGGGLGNCHTFQHLFPSSKYGKDHPEYFALRDGKRLVSSGGGDDFCTQPCLSNPDVLRIVTSNVLARIARDPSATYYGVSQNDNSMYCECPRCAAIDAEEGSPAGTLIRFVNAVAEEVERKYPGKIVETLAYRYTRKPPKLTRPRANVMPCLCSIECDFSRRMDESRYPANVSFVEDIKGWNAICRQLYVWDYVTDFHNYPYPMPNVYALQGNVRFMIENGVKALFTQGDRQGSHAGFAELKAWLLAKWMWNPDLPMKPLLDDFFAGYYGAGAPYVREFFEKLHAAELAYTAASPDRYLPCETPFRLSGRNNYLNPGVPMEVFEEGAKLLDRAEAAVKGDKVREYNVGTIRFSVDYTLLENAFADRRGDVAVLPGAEGQLSDQADLSAVAKRALRFFDAVKTIRLCSSSGRQDRILSRWRLAAERQKPVVRDFVEDSAFALQGVGSWTDRVDDPDALDGKAVKAYNVRPGWSTSMQMDAVAFGEGIPYRMSVRVKLDRHVPGRDGTAFTAGIYDYEKKAHLASVGVRASKMSEKFAWYDVGVVKDVPPAAQFFFAAGHRDKDGQPHAGDVLIDRIRFERADGK